MKILLRWTSIVLISVWSSQATPADAQEHEYPYSDLHAHLFMNEGMGPLFQGDFYGKLKAKTWRHKLSNQITPKALNDSKLGLVVVALYALPVLVNARKSIRRQIALAERFVAESPEWVIAKSPEEARTARQQGKRILVFSLEGASNVLRTDEDIREFVHERGVRIVTFAHLMDDRFTGCAMLHGMKGFANPFRKIQHLFGGKKLSEGVKVNPRGLTAKGVTLAQKLVQNGVWIDLSHASDPATQQLLEITRNHQPPLYTHTTLRKYYGAERGVAEWQLRLVAERSGIVGLVPGSDMLKGTEKTVLRGQCFDDLDALATQWQEVAAVVGEDAVTIGSDFNGAITHLKPAQCQSTRTSLDSKGGLWNIAQTPDLWNALVQRGAALPKTRSPEIIETFLEAWSRVQPQPQP